jgi:hypothetical protein
VVYIIDNAAEEVARDLVACGRQLQEVRKDAQRFALKLGRYAHGRWLYYAHRGNTPSTGQSSGSLPLRAAMARCKLLTLGKPASIAGAAG